MRMLRRFSIAALIAAAHSVAAPTAWAQSQPPDTGWFVDLGAGIDASINGNVNSGAIGTVQGLATAILPQRYSDVYGTGIEFRFGGGYTLDRLSEVRGMFIYQSADADLVRLGDIGPSSLYGQYSDYKSLGLDLGYRRYFPVAMPGVRLFGEATIGAAFIDRIDVRMAAPQANLVLNQNDFYDGSAAFTWSIGAGAAFRLTDKVDVNAQIGLRHVGGLSQVDQLVGTGLDEINNDSARMTFPVVVGVRIRLK